MLVRMKSEDEILAISRLRSGTYNRLFSKYSNPGSWIDMYQFVDCGKIIEVDDNGNGVYFYNHARRWDIPTWACEIIPETNFDRI